MADVILPNYIHNAATYRRVKRWIKYMDKHIKPRLGYNRIILLDNTSDLKFLKKLGCTIHNEKNELLHVGRGDLFAYRYETHYSRTGHLEYPYYWRSVYQLPKFDGTFYQSDKYYWIDSDVYLLRNEIIDHIRNQNSGFIRYKDRKYNWGESIFMTINRDAFQLLIDHEKNNGGWLNRKDCAEHTLPKTLIDDTFNGGRYPEQGTQQDDTMFWLGQCDQSRPHYKVRWNNGKPD